MSDQPSFVRWSRKLGGLKVCPQCQHRHKPVQRINGKATRVRSCCQCEAELSSELVYPKRTRVHWLVRETDPKTGQIIDHRMPSREIADEFIRIRQRDHTSDPIQKQLLERASVLIRTIKVAGLDDGMNQLIQLLGGDPTNRQLRDVGWDGAIDTISNELADKGRAGTYVRDFRRILTDFRALTKIDDLKQIDLDAIARYRARLVAGGWKRGKRTVKPMAGRTVNRQLSTLSAFLSYAVRKRFVARNVLLGQRDERVKVSRIRVRYMPDADLQALINAADEQWLKTLVIVAYYTAARRGDLLRLEWDGDIDLHGEVVAAEGRSGPHIYIRGTKADTPHWMPLHSGAVDALHRLRAQPIVSPRVFPVKGSRCPSTFVSRRFAQLCMRAGLTMQVEKDGKQVTKNRWSLHDLRRKANTDLRNVGASAKERSALLGHKTTSVNEIHYEALLPSRERMLIDSLSAFRLTG